MRDDRARKTSNRQLTKAKFILGPSSRCDEMTAECRHSASLVKMKPNRHAGIYPTSPPSLVRYLVERLVTLLRSLVATPPLRKSNSAKARSAPEFPLVVHNAGAWSQPVG